MLTQTKPFTGEFLVSEAPGTLSREVITLGIRAEMYLDGTPMTAAGGVYSGAGTFAGILYGNYDASVTAVEAVVIARLAEVKDASILYAEDAKDETLTAMTAAHIRTHPRLDADDITENGTEEPTELPTETTTP